MSLRCAVIRGKIGPISFLSLYFLVLVCVLVVESEGQALVVSVEGERVRFLVRSGHSLLPEVYSGANNSPTIDRRRLDRMGKWRILLCGGGGGGPASKSTQLDRKLLYRRA